MTHGDQTNTNMAIQLAVDKGGIIRGNFTDTKTNLNLSVQGSVDKKTERAAWTIGDKKNDVMETGAVQPDERRSSRCCTTAKIGPSNGCWCGQLQAGSETRSDVELICLASPVN